MTIFDEGFNRIFLKSDENDDRITVFIPLTVRGMLNRAGHRPWLVKAVWDGFEYLGEFDWVDGDFNRFSWEHSEPSATDFGKKRLRVGAVVTVYETTLTSTRHRFRVADVRRV